MTTYLERDAALIKWCLPGGTEVPEDSDDLFLIYGVLLRAKGLGTQAADVHDAWSAWMLRVDPQHESIRPYTELDSATRGEDDPFLVAIRAAAAHGTQ